MMTSLLVGFRDDNANNAIVVRSIVIKVEGRAGGGCDGVRGGGKGEGGW